MQYKLSIFLLWLLYLLFSNTIPSLHAQQKEIFLIDQDTKEPIELVSAFFPATLKGTISNKEGKIKIEISEDSLHISHVLYQSKVIAYPDFTQVDTIYLESKPFMLQEVLVVDFDMKAFIQSILDNFLELYDNEDHTYKCTFKEKLLINDSLARLYQIQLDYYSKHYIHTLAYLKYIKSWNIFSLSNIDYAKVTNSSGYQGKGAGTLYIKNNNLLSLIHLNHEVIILNNHVEEFKIESISDTETERRIIFSGDAIINEIKTFSYNQSEMVIDKVTGAIIQLNAKRIYDVPFRKLSPPKFLKKYQGMEYEMRTTRHDVNLSFNKLNNNKYILSFFSTELVTEVKETIDSVLRTNEATIKVEMTVNDIKNGNTIKKSDALDLKTPFYKNVPKYKGLEVKMPLTTQELIFLNKADE